MSGKHHPRKKPDPLSTLINILRDKEILRPDEESPKSLRELVDVLIQKARIDSLDAEKVTGYRGRGKGRYKALLDLLEETGILDADDLRLF